MIKLRKYLKPFVASILMIVVLLFTQAMCELKMPDYMSDIVNVGIHANGIEDGVFDAIRASEVDKLKLFMDEKAIETFEASYEKVDANTASSEVLKDYPSVQNEAIYVIKDLSDDQRETLKNTMASAETMVMSINQASENKHELSKEELADLSDEQRHLMEMMKDLPKGANLFDTFAYMPKEAKQKMLDSITSLQETMGTTTLDTANAQYVYAEYQALGADVNAIQYGYLFRQGSYMLLVALASACSAVAVGFLASRIAAGFGRDLRGAVFQKVQSFSSAEFNEFSTNTLITRTTNDIQQAQLVLVMFLRIVIYAPIIGIGAVLKVITTNADMTWVIGLVVAVILSIMATAFFCVMPKFKRLQKLMDKLNGVVREMLDGLSVIRAFNNQNKEKEKFEAANNNIMKTNLFTARAMSMLMPLIMLVMNSATILIVWVGAHQIDEGVLQIGDMMAFMQYAMQIIMAFMMITMISIMIPRASVAAGRVAELLHTTASIKDPEQPKSLQDQIGKDIVFDHVSFAYPGAEEEVLKDISFVAHAGKTTAFIGSTGSGKSTIINLIPRFYDVSEGSIRIGDCDIKDVTQHELRDHIGYVPQKGVLFSGTIASNLLYAKEDASDEELQEAARIAQASDFINEKANGFDESITQGGTNVSGGQRQRLSIARALVKQADIYIFDDTFSALDFKTDAKLRKELYAMCEKTKATVLLVAQRISTIMHADQIVVLDEGKIAGIGTHEQLLKDCKVYQEIAYSQLSKEELENE